MFRKRLRHHFLQQSASQRTSSDGGVVAKGEGFGGSGASSEIESVSGFARGHGDGVGVGEGSVVSARAIGHLSTGPVAEELLVRLALNSAQEGPTIGEEVAVAIGAGGGSDAAHIGARGAPGDDGQGNVLGVALDVPLHGEIREVTAGPVASGQLGGVPIIISTNAGSLGVGTGVDISLTTG